MAKNAVRVKATKAWAPPHRDDWVYHLRTITPHKAWIPTIIRDAREDAEREAELKRLTDHVICLEMKINAALATGNLNKLRDE